MDPRRVGSPVLALTVTTVLLGSVALRAESAPDPGTGVARPSPRAPVLVGGVDVGERRADTLARAMRTVGLDTWQVSYEARLRVWDGALLDFAEPEPGALRRRLRAAREAGLRVMLVLRMRLDPSEPRNRHLWHGLAWPRDDAVGAFFARYREYVLWAAEIAEDEGVTMLVVGNELNALASTGVERPSVLTRALDVAQLEREAASLRRCSSDGPVPWHDGGTYPDLESAIAGEQRALRAWGAQVSGPEAGRRARLRARRAQHEDAWRAILDEARAHFHGLLSYGAGFDTYREVGFWDATDALVATAYFGLERVGDHATPAQLEAAWARHLRGLAAVAAARPSRPALPVYFGELGYTRRAHGSVRPWSYEGFETLPRADGENVCVRWSDVAIAPQERARAFAALAGALAHGALPQLRGFSLWKLTLNDAHAALEPYALRLPALDEAPSARLAEERATLAAIEALAAQVRQCAGSAGCGAERDAP